MIALDFDGVVANYGDHTTQLRLNDGLFALLPRRNQPVAIVSNQGGMALHPTNSAKYPSPQRVAHRLQLGCHFLLKNGYPVAQILVAAYHPKATDEQVQRAARELRAALRTFRWDWSVYTTERARKPHPLMLRACGATVFYGDSPEDGEAAVAAGIPFVSVPRFL